MENPDPMMDDIRGNRTLIKWGIASATVIGFLVLFIKLVTSQTHEPTSTAQEARAANDVQQQILERRTAEHAQHEGQALSNSQLRATVELGRKALDAVAEFDAEVQKWELEVAPLLTNDKGKFIAANKDHVKAFVAINEKPRPARSEADAIRTTIKTLMQPAVDALSDNTAAYVPGQPVNQAIQDQKTAAEVATQVYRDRRLIIVGLAPPTNTPPPANAPTLAMSIDAIRREQAQEQAAKIAAAEDNARRERDERLAQARAEQIRKTTEEEEKALATETAINKEKAKAERFRRRAADTEVQKKFAPFLSKGRWNWVNSHNVHLVQGRYTDFPQSMSLTDMQAGGALKSPEAFAKAGAGDSLWYYNDRQKWTYPRTQEEMDGYKVRLEEFIELSPYWIESGILLK